jgi:hypothetical protein
MVVAMMVVASASDGFPAEVNIHIMLKRTLLILQRTCNGLWYIDGAVDAPQTPTIQEGLHDRGGTAKCELHSRCTNNTISSDFYSNAQPD